MIWSASRIGIFDSGVGGLTVLGAIRRLFLHGGHSASLFYLGDTEHLPYGSKTVPFLRQLAHRNIQFFNQLGLDLLVVACNTSHSVAMDIIVEESDCPVIGVIDPAVRSIANAYRRPVDVGVIATERTVQSGSYLIALHEALPSGSRIYQQACPLLVPLIEEWDGDASVVRLIVNAYLSNLLTNSVEEVVLGCTHYPFLADTIKSITDVRVFDPAYAVAREVGDFFGPLVHTTRDEDEDIHVMVTGSVNQFKKTLSRLKISWVPEVNQVAIPLGVKVYDI